jgi:hypothetical protein
VTNRSANIANINRSKWEHNADHRQGVRYNNADVRQKFAKTDIQAGKAARQDFRGKEGQKVLEPDRGRSDTGDRDRPATGDRDRSSAGNRDRAGASDRDRPQARDSGGRQDAGKKAAAAAKPSSKTGQKPSREASQKGSQPSSKPQRDTAFSNVQSGSKTRAEANRGRQSVGGGGGAPRVAAHGGGGGGAPRMSSGAAPRTAARAGGGRGGGGRRSDITLKHNIALLGRLDNGLGFYRFSYNGSDQIYVGVMAQEVQTIAPEAVVRTRDGYLEVLYDKLGLKFQTYDQWVASGARVPSTTRVRH